MSLTPPDCFFFFPPLPSPPDPRGDHCVIRGGGVHRRTGSTRAPVEVYRTSDHHPHRGPHRPLWFPGGRGEGGKTLGHSYAVSSHVEVNATFSGSAYFRYIEIRRTCTIYSR